MSRAAKKKTASEPVLTALCSQFAPWMEIAWSQEGIKLNPPDSFIAQLRLTLQIEEKLQTLQSMGLSSRGTANGGKFKLTNWKSSGKPQLKNPVPELIAGWEKESLTANNPEIVKYFEGLKTDPRRNPKGKSYDIEATNINKGGWGADVNAWCAAFVNWCLKEANAPYLNYATASSWLNFGTEVSAPVYGCVTIIKPQSTTGGGTGHVAFFVGRKGSNVQLLGGNQSRQVKVSEWNEQRNVIGYRWPSSIDDYLSNGGRPSCDLPAWAK
jgi:uncharacterized protein (TIGR02594 family)